MMGDAETIPALGISAFRQTETGRRVSIEEGVTPSVGWLALYGSKGQTIATPYLLMRETMLIGRGGTLGVDRRRLSTAPLGVTWVGH